jgi:hypothetical protein
MGRKLRDVADILTSLIEKTNSDGIRTKWKRTKFMILPRKLFNENKYVNIGTYNFEMVKGSKCVGKIVTKIN